MARIIPASRFAEQYAPPPSFVEPKHQADSGAVRGARRLSGEAVHGAFSLGFAMLRTESEAKLSGYMTPSQTDRDTLSKRAASALRAETARTTSASAKAATGGEEPISSLANE